MLVKKIMRQLLKKLGLKRKYQVSGVEVVLDFNHLGPDYRKAHPMYDKFLIHLVNYLPRGTMVVEVGANVGYVCIEMARNNNSLEFVIFEADDRTFEDLQRNIASLRKIEPNVSVTIVKDFIGLDVDNVSLENYSGSNHAVLNGGKIKSKMLTEAFGELDLNYKKIGLLITDVDGYDWDVIRSSHELINENPFIYFECFYSNQSQLESFSELFNELKARGYSDFAFFDNFGQYICTTNDLLQIKDLLDYVARQNSSRSSRTMHYYDVFSFSENNAALAKEIISDFNDQKQMGS